MENKIIFKDSALAHKYLGGLKGLEIGGASHNPFNLDTKNVDINLNECILKETILPDNSIKNELIGLNEYAKEQIRLCGTVMPVDINAPGDALPVPDNSQDFIISSHVLEHFYNPIKALNHWYSKIKPGGFIFMIIPHKDRTFDKDRPRTSLQELIQRNEDIEASGIEHNIDAHHSVWITQDLILLCEYLQMPVIDFQDQDDKVGNGFTIVIQKPETEPVIISDENSEIKADVPNEDNSNNQEPEKKGKRKSRKK